MYQLTPKALEAINEARPEGIVRELTYVLKCSDSTVNRHIRENEPNGDLTKKAAIEVIQKMTGLLEAEVIEPALTKAEA